MSHVDYVPPNTRSSQGESLLYIFGIEHACVEVTTVGPLQWDGWEEGSGTHILRVATLSQEQMSPNILIGQHGVADVLPWCGIHVALFLKNAT